ncbi:MAG: RNA polymerase factor sigma-54 [Nitrospirae bacterium]|nr:RNA polymerase factor sigma-54 [Nitrospirota bacterium]
MALENKLELKLGQKLILTPQLQQSIKLLQLPLLELSQNLTQELMENPFLEETIEGVPEESMEISETAKEEEPQVKTHDDTEEPLEKLFDFKTSDYFESRASDGRDLGYFNDGTEALPPFDYGTKKPDLYEQLLWQLRLSRRTEQVGKVAEVIISNLNGDGYLQESLEDIARTAEVNIATAQEALRLIHEFDPPGVGAKDLQECLLLQLKPLNLENTIVEKILTEGFTELNSRKYRQLAARLKMSLEDILVAIKIIEGLDPKPGRNYTKDEAIHITPDVYVEEAEGEFIIMLNDEGIPRLRLSNRYRKLLTSKNKNELSPEEKKFLEEKMRAALWLIKSLDQRNRTIYRVTESILKFQGEFFRQGIGFLKPMTLRDVATDLSMHESTISRVTSNKYLQCPRGLLNFKFFFSNSVSGRGDVSSTSVKEIIKELIASEDTKAPLSDKSLVEILKGREINIAHRTVAKYREELKILSHLRRKKWT